MVCSNLLSQHHACRRTIACTCLQTIYKDVNILHFVHFNREYHVYKELVENYHAFIVMKSCKPTITMLSIFIPQYATALLLIPCNYKHMNRKPLSILGCYYKRLFTTSTMKKHLPCINMQNMICKTLLPGV